MEMKWAVVVDQYGRPFCAPPDQRAEVGDELVGFCSTREAAERMVTVLQPKEAHHEP